MTDTQNMSDKDFAALHFSVEDDEGTEQELDPIEAADMKYVADSTGPDTIDFMDDPDEEQPPAEEEPPPAEPDPEDKAEETMSAAELKARLEMEEKRRRDLQSWADKRHNELQQQIERMQQAPQQPQQPQQAVTGEQIKSAVEDNPVAAFQWTVQHSPENISRVISTIREVHGNEMADEAQVAYSQVQAMYQQQMVEERLEAMRQQQIQEQAPDILRKGMETIVGEFAQQDEEGFRRIAPRVMELVKANWNEFTEATGGDVSPYTVRDFIQRNVLTAYREEATKARMAPPAQSQELTPADKVEGGTPGSAPVADDRSEEDEIADEIVAAYEKSRYH